MKKLLVTALLLTIAPACIVVHRGPPPRHPHRHHLALAESPADAPTSELPADAQ